MKRPVTLIMLCALWQNVTAQTPQKMSYQAVIRDAGGNLVVNKQVGMRITILEGALPGSSVYQETQTPTTNANGLVTIEIGGGTGFDAVNWGNDIHFIKTETDPEGGTNYSILGTSQLLSVPYAFYAGTTKVGGTPGQVQFNNNGKLEGDAGLFWDNTSKKFGLGMSSPVTKLSLSGGDENTEISLFNNATGLTNNDGFKVGMAYGTNNSVAWLWHNENADIYFGTNNQFRMMISSEGKVSIGKNNPYSPFSVHVADDQSEMHLTNNTTGSLFSDGLKLGIDAGANSNAYLLNLENSDLYLGTNNQSWMMISAQGDIGIGTNAPSSKLDVNGQINVNSNKIVNVADPVNPQDAATKAYVDALINQLSKLGAIVADTDGNIYPTVRIGSQIWMAENLKTTKYNDGTEIPTVMDVNSSGSTNDEWAALTTPAWCYYGNDANNGNTYGALYNWYTVNTGKLCPTGWHVPSDAEWTTLSTFLGGEGVAGGKMKETGTTHWYSPNNGASNESGFSGLPGGIRASYGPFSNFGYYGFWWSSVESSPDDACGRYLHFYQTYVHRNFSAKAYGFSVRCVRDN